MSKRTSPSTSHTPELAATEVIAASVVACQEINKFTEQVFKTRGGRMGSGMGVLLEALWAYYIDQGRAAGSVGNDWWEIGWLPDHEYNDFACIEFNQPWDHATRVGELFRIEAKSMNTDADESKGHFDQLADTLGPFDMLLVLIWSWQPADRGRVFPAITDHFIDSALPIAQLRDTLHVARGGTFVDRKKCPDGCRPKTCSHHGEPLNADGKRERASGPETCRSAKQPSAKNFGGLIRMLKSNSSTARTAFQDHRRNSDVVHKFVSFIHRNYPREEENAYRMDSWREAAKTLGLDTTGDASTVIARVRSIVGYMDTLRSLK